MKKGELMSKMTLTVHKVGFELQKKSPEILVGVGIVGAVASAVMACKATTKINPILDTIKDTIDQIHEAKDAGVTRSGEDYSADDSKKDLAITYVQTGAKLAKLYAPSVMVGAMSITCILASHKVLKERNAAIAAAYTAVSQSFTDYRKRVVDRFGEQVEKELRYNIKAKTVEETEVNEDGKEKKVKKTVTVVDDELVKYSPYARFFDETHPEWLKDPEQNLFYLRARQSQANDMLKEKGHMLLNEVYDLLGFPRTKAGAVVGWVYDPDNAIGDNYIDFGMYTINREKTRDFLNGFEPAIILDFNVSGEIIDLIETHQNI